MDSDKILSRLNSLVEKDIRVQFKNKEEHEENRRNSTLRFAKYLVSIITHSIGVVASVMPLNTKEGYVLLYIMELFKISELDLDDMFMTGNFTPDTVTPKKKDLFRYKKFHSWRPEVVLRLGCPRQLNHDQLENLSIRVYLFKEDTIPKLNPNELKKRASKVEKNKQILEMIFSKFRLDPSILIRPVNELRSLVKFKPTFMSVDEKKMNPNSGLGYMSKLAMTCSYRNMTTISDLRLPIRRYYCDPKLRYILRFEFWIDNRGRGRGCIYCINSSVRAVVYNGICSCLKKKESIYMNEHNDFYGYINLRLAQLPSYPIQKRFLILSLQNKQVDSCELISDIRNRQVLDTYDRHTLFPDGQIRKSNEEFMVSHIRLYVNCLLYHCKALSTSETQPQIQEVTLDSLFYLPAHCLINQHRLQGNLSKIEDRYLRRISILLLLINLQNFELLDQIDSVHTQLICRYLIAIAQNEYLIAHKPLDERTGQDVHLFEVDSNKSKINRTGEICDLEVRMMNSFMIIFLQPKVTTWLSQPKGAHLDVETLLMLGGMRLLRSCLTYFKKCRSGWGLQADVRMKIRKIKNDFESHLCSVILEILGTGVRQAIRMDEKGRKRNPEILWFNLLHEIKFINQNLCLNWSTKGLDSLFSRTLSGVDTSRFIKNIHGLKSVLEGKLDEYIR